MQAERVIISDDKSKLQPEVIHRFLSNSYWSEGIPLEVVLRSIKNSICFGIYAGTDQVGFARVITDKSTFAYLADVFVLEPYRGIGLSKRLMQYIIDYPELKGLRRWMLATRDAHGLYKRYGFQPLALPDRWMEKHMPDVYAVEKI